MGPEMAQDSQPNIRRPYIAANDARDAIATLRAVLDRLGARPETEQLAICIAFAQEALWAASYPDDPYSMLDMIAANAENALG